jgi:hypothetical protein
MIHATNACNNNPPDSILVLSSLEILDMCSIAVNQIFRADDWPRYTMEPICSVIDDAYA